jgi:hypothetical protein
VFIDSNKYVSKEISVWCMKCVGYDVDFQCALAKMPKNYVSPKDKKTKEKKMGKSKSVKKTPKVRETKAKAVKSASKKRKRQEVEASSDEDSEWEQGP